MNSFEENERRALIEWYEKHSDTNVNITFLGSEEHYAHFIEQFKEILPTYREKLPKVIHDNLASVDLPVELKLYVASQCPHCPEVIRTLIPLAAECKKIHLKIIDGTIYTKEADEDKVMSVPCLILDNGFRWIGAVNPEEVADMVVNRDPSCLTSSSLKMILEEGKAGWIAQQMLEQRAIFSGFIPLLTHETWSVRLGAMVVLEEIAEKNSDLALTIAPTLFKSFGGADIPTQGDILYALGESGDESVRDKIISLMAQITHPEVVEAARAALEAIESRVAGV